MAKKARQRATSIHNFLSMKFERIAFEGAWRDAFDQPEKGGIWYVGGRPTNGKTSFVVQLIKVLAELGMKVRFFNFEEQASISMQETICRERLIDVAHNVQVISFMLSYAEIRKELETTRTHVAVIDTIQKSGITKAQVEELRRDFPDVLIVFVSHVLPNGLPEKAPANQAYREASLKIYVDRFRAISQGRYFGKLGYYDIWEEKAAKCWAENV